MSRINEKQIAEWTENPVTIELLKLVKEELIKIVLTPTGDCLHFGDPNKTYESLVRMDSEEHTFATIQLALEGDWGYFEELDDE
jgi:hypothetical protein